MSFYIESKIFSFLAHLKRSLYIRKTKNVKNSQTYRYTKRHKELIVFKPKKSKLPFDHC